jgi:hypothetical protein
MLSPAQNVIKCNSSRLLTFKPWRIARAKDDQRLPTNCPMFGFNIVDGRRVVNQAQAAALRQAGEIILQEGRSGSAARWLNSHGWHTTRGKPFRATSVVAIFRNPALIGETTINFKEETVVIRHQAILDEATFQAINAVLDGQRLRKPRGTVFYALRGIAYCKCGAKFEPLNNGRRYHRCKARCGEKLWRKDELEYEVAEAFTRYLEDRERRQDHLLLAQKSADSLRHDLAEVNKALQRNKSEWTKLLRKDLGGYPTDIVEGAKTGLQAEAQALERQKCRIEADLAALPQVEPAEVERELMALAEPWALASGDGRINAGGAARYELGALFAGCGHVEARCPTQIIQ